MTRQWLAVAGPTSLHSPHAADPIDRSIDLGRTHVTYVVVSFVWNLDTRSLARVFLNTQGRKRTRFPSGAWRSRGRQVQRTRSASRRPDPAPARSTFPLGLGASKAVREKYQPNPAGATKQNSMRCSRYPSPAVATVRSARWSSIVNWIGARAAAGEVMTPFRFARSTRHVDYLVCWREDYACWCWLLLQLRAHLKPRDPRPADREMVPPAARRFGMNDGPLICRTMPIKALPNPPS